MATWRTYNPDPKLIRPVQWGHWHPSHTQPQQLKSLLADGGWMAAPGAMLSGSLRRLSVGRSSRSNQDCLDCRGQQARPLSARRVTETRNTFSVLQEDSEPQMDSTLPGPMETSQGRSIGSTPCGGSAPGCSTSLGPSRRSVGRTPALRPSERRPASKQLCGKLRQAGCVQGCCEKGKVKAAF